MALVKFREITRAAYNNLINKEANTQYYITETDGTFSIAFGDRDLKGNQGVEFTTSDVTESFSFTLPQAKQRDITMFNIFVKGNGYGYSFHSLTIQGYNYSSSGSPHNLSALLVGNMGPSVEIQVGYSATNETVVEISGLGSYQSYQVEAYSGYTGAHSRRQLEVRMGGQITKGGQTVTTIKAATTDHVVNTTGNQNINGAKDFRNVVGLHAGLNMNSTQIKQLAAPTVNTDAANKKYVDDKVAAGGGGGGGGGTQLGAVRINVNLDDWTMGDISDTTSNGIEVTYDGLPSDDVQIWLFRYINKPSQNGSLTRRTNAMRHFYYTSWGITHQHYTESLGLEWNGNPLTYNTGMGIPTIIPTTQMLTKTDGLLRATLIASEHVEAIIESIGIQTANDLYVNWERGWESTVRTAILGVAAVKKNPNNSVYPIVGPMTKFSLGFKPITYGHMYSLKTKIKML